MLPVRVISEPAVTLVTFTPDELADTAIAVGAINETFVVNASEASMLVIESVSKLVIRLGV